MEDSIDQIIMKAHAHMKKKLIILLKFIENWIELETDGELIKELADIVIIYEASF